MKDVFLDELGALAKTCGRDLNRKSNLEQAETWTEEFKRDEIAVIHEAFVYLRASGGFEGTWPTYPEIKRAFAKARDRAREAAEAVARAERNGAVIKPGRLSAAVVYASRNRDMSREDLESAIATILNPKVTDEDVEKFIGKRDEMGMPARRVPAHTEQELKEFAAKNRGVAA